MRSNNTGNSTANNANNNNLRNCDDRCSVLWHGCELQI